MITCLLLALVVVIQASPGQETGAEDRSSAPGNEIAVSITQTAEPTDELSLSRTVAKLIPDFSMLDGSPTTTVDLSEIIENNPVFESGSPVTIAVIANKKEKVVGAKIVDNRFLVLAPGKVGKSELLIEFQPTVGVPVHSKFNVEVWRPDFWKLALTVIGGLGIFLFGMKSMSDGLQAVARNRLRQLISLVTTNRFMATGVGTLVTMVLQSSSITTVMVVGFVNCGIMTLAQAIGVIFGANIGTTITGWILVLSVGKYGLPLAGAAAIGYLFLKKDRWRYLSMAVMGLGLVFMGLELMKDGFAIIKDLPAFEAWFERFSADTYFGVLRCAAVGCVLTFIVQSSSATLGITIGLAQLGVIPFETAAALVLGENIGTTITAWLASFGTTTNARRAAYAHVAFNVIGVAWITAVFPWYIMLVKYVVAGNVNADVSSDVTAAIAATHTGFNVANTIFFLPFAGVMARVLTRIIPDRAVPETPQLTNLDVRILESPVLALEQSRAEVLRMAATCRQLMDFLGESLKSRKTDTNVVRRASEAEDLLDTIEDEIVSFITRLLASNIPEELINDARLQLRMAAEYESIGDYVGRILKYQIKLHESELEYEAPEREHLLELHVKVSEYLQSVSQSYKKGQQKPADIVVDKAGHIARDVRLLRREIMDRMAQSGMPPRISVTYNRQINAYRRVRDHVVNIAEALSGIH